MLGRLVLDGRRVGPGGGAVAAMAAPLVDGGLSVGGVTGGAGTLAGASDETDTARSAGESDASDGRLGGLAMVVCRRMSDSLAMTPRRRRNGIVGGGSGRSS